MNDNPNSNQASWEHFKQSVNVSYAVFLITQDELRTDDSLGVSVIFELGYFLAKLGHQNMCVLHTPGMEHPSEISGLLYIPIDSQGEWRYQLVRAMKNAGIELDFSQAL